MVLESNTCRASNQPHELCLCPLEGIIDIISRKWTLHIVAVIGNHRILRFKKIQQHLRNSNKKISPKTLADRLKELAEHGLIVRRAFAEIPPRVEYALTPKGEAMKQAMIPLMEWASDHWSCQRVPMVSESKKQQG